MKSGLGDLLWTSRSSFISPTVVEMYYLLVYDILDCGSLMLGTIARVVPTYDGQHTKEA